MIRSYNGIFYIIILFILIALSSCGTTYKRAYYVAETPYPVANPCDNYNFTNSIYLDSSYVAELKSKAPHANLCISTSSIRNGILYDSTFVELQTICEKKVKVYLPNDTISIYSLADVNSPRKLELTISCIKDPDTCLCKSNFYKYEIGYSYINRFIDDKKVDELTYTFFDRNGNIKARNVPSKNLNFLYLAYYLPISSDQKFSLGGKGGIILGDSINPFPIALSLKYLSNPNPEPARFNCKAYPWYHCFSLRADLEIGILLDNTGAPIIASNFKYQRLYLSSSFGVQWRNFSLNLGLNYLRMPLGQVDCCPLVPDEYKFPVRNSLNPFINFNVSF